ncbi:MAG TPA: hypothetical protein P5084_01705 [Paludibacter sp.]|nr:hypothetical protein [Paludibacter sp.]
MNSKLKVNYNPGTDKMTLESDEAIITTSLDNIIVVANSIPYTFTFKCIEQTYKVENIKNDFNDFVTEIGFLKIQSNYAINPQKITAYRRKTLEIEINNDLIFPVETKYRKKIIDFIKGIDHNLNYFSV